MGDNICILIGVILIGDNWWVGIELMFGFIFDVVFALET